MKWRLFGPCLVIKGVTVSCGSDGKLGGYFLAGDIFEEPEVHEEDSAYIQMSIGNIWVLGEIWYLGYLKGL